jgi:transposase
MIDRGWPGQVVGEALLKRAYVLFVWWHWVRDGTWQRSTFQLYVRTLRASFKMELEWGSLSACPKTAATCRELLAREAALWTFVRVDGIDPTNNASEVRLVGQKPNTQEVWRIGPGAVRTQFLWPQNLIPVSV